MSGSTMSRIPQDTDHYFWYTDEVIGQGATSLVYRCREKETGHQFAVKVFTGRGLFRGSKATERELSVLGKFKECAHENIVKIIAMEEQKSIGNYAIIMEYCAGGSLHCILDRPENAHGFKEDDFKKVMFDVVSGMKYLKDEGIIHRDIKPGNILRFIKDDGSFVYKLSDFGAARELQPDEQFMSVYGTEEYLHPDMYEKGVLKRSIGEKTFGANVDLWSLGATFYHIASGKLPFRPYSGRRSRETMYSITSKKASGVISGIQKEEGGTIEWSDKLPENTHLSSGLKEYIVKILARLLENDPTKAMTFEELFQAVQQIKDMKTKKAWELCKTTNLAKVIHVHSALSGTSHVIYANPEGDFSSFQELIAIQTGVSARQQDLFFNNDTFKPSSVAKISTYPDTTKEKAILVLGGDGMVLERSHGQPQQLKKTRFGSSVGEDQIRSDAFVSKTTANNVHWNVSAIKNIEQSRLLTLEAAENVITLLKRKARKYLNDARAIENHCQSMVMKHEACLNGCKFEMEVIQTLGSDHDIPNEIVEEKHGLLQDTRSFESKIEKLQKDMNKPLERLRAQAQSLLSDGELGRKWRHMNKDVGNENYVGMVENYSAKVDQITQNFFKRCNRKDPSSEDLKNHKFERMRVEEYFTSVQEAVEACQNRKQVLHENFRIWLEEVYECRAKMKRTREELESFIDMFDVVIKSEEKWRGDHMIRMKSILGEVRTQVRRAISVPGSTSDHMMVDGGNDGDSMSLGSEFTADINQKLSDLSFETKEAKSLMQKSAEKFQRFVQELMEELNEKRGEEDGV